MARIVVFDSGLGSLSVIKAIQKVVKADIIYFADQNNFPYGRKSRARLDAIIKRSIKGLQARFSPDVIVMASNTPSLMLDVSDLKVIDVKPPLNTAQKISRSKKIGVLGTESAVRSRGLSKYIKECNLPKPFKILKINGSQLVDLVESGRFLTDKQRCRRIIRKTLKDVVLTNSIDTITLSSTHLPFLKSLLNCEFPHVRFVDPGEIVAQKVFKRIKDNQSKRSSLKIFTSGDPVRFQKNLAKLQIRDKVSVLVI